MTDPWSLEKLTLRNGLRMRVARAGQGDPLVLMLHGFPECWYSWRHQLTALTEAGFRVIAPDMRGYGRTEQPTEMTNTRCSIQSAIWWDYSMRWGCSTR
jgi:pimeloyl-ACP methyl ester carboxylesterase